MNQHDILMDGFKLLNNISIGEIEERIEWLEETLEAYKSILSVKKSIKTKPIEIDIPEKFVEFEVKTKDGIPIKNKLIKFLKDYPSGVRSKDIAITLELNPNSVSTTLSSNRDTFEYINDNWKLKNGQNN